MTERKNETNSEGDIEDDDHVAASRAGKKGNPDGSYVGRTFNDEAFDDGMTGAEARSTDGK